MKTNFDLTKEYLGNITYMLPDEMGVDLLEYAMIIDLVNTDDVEGYLDTYDVPEEARPYLRESRKRIIENVKKGLN